MAEPALVCRPHPGSGELRQGEVLSGVVEIRPSVAWVNGGFAGSAVVDKLTHEYCVVVSQDCDLAQDFNARASGRSEDLPHVVLCRAAPLAGIKDAEKLGRDEWKRLKQNRDPKWHHLQETPAEFDAQQIGVPALGIDFSKHFSLPTEVLYAQLSGTAKRRIVMNSPYFEHLTTRFAAYVARIGLPQNHATDEPQRQLPTAGLL